MAKDLFSKQADQYAKYRPTYPESLFEYILSFVKDRKMAWDCATGNGQAAARLADYFENVEATDLSEAQLQHAVQKKNIHYQVSKAETTPFNDNTFNLITVATAYHWLDWDAFHKEASRVGKPGCVVAIWSTYTLHTEEQALQDIYNHFYWDIIGPYWEPERKFVDDQYRTVRFDFKPLPPEVFTVEVLWTKDEFKGYLDTWSASQKYTKEKGHSPLQIITERLDDVWNDIDVKPLSILLCFRIGEVVK